MIPTSSVLTGRQWISKAGPRQTKLVNKALSDLRTEHNQYVELAGVIGASETSYNYYAPFGKTQRPDVTAVQSQIGEEFDYTVTRENFSQIITAVNAALPTLKASRPIDDKRRSPDEEAQRLEKLEVSRKKREALNQQHAADVTRLTEELHEQYPWAKSDDNTMSRQARAAANLSEELALAFPDTKFTVRSDSASMTSSVDYSWTLGPKTDVVRAIADKYSYGRFDSSQDLDRDDDSAYGDAVERVLGRAKFCQGQRLIPNNIRERVGRLLCTAQHIEFNGDNTQHLFGDGDRRWLSDHVYQLLARTSFPANAEITGIVYSEGGYDETTEETIQNGYQLTFNALQQLCPDPRHDTPCPLPCEACAVDGCERPSTDSPTITENREKNGIEIRFPIKPAEETRTTLKRNGFRWSRQSACWYAKASESSRTFAATLISTVNQIQAASEPPQPTTRDRQREATEHLRILRPFIGHDQLTVIEECSSGEEQDFFFDKLAEYAQRVQSMPKTYQQESIDDPIVYLHYFTGACDWHVTERDQEDEQSQAFGLCNLGYGAELGYVNLEEITRLGAEIDLYFKPCPLSQIRATQENIQAA